MAGQGLVGILTQVVVVLLTLVGSSVQELCRNTCDCTISTDTPGGVHNIHLTCLEGSVSWYNPFGALQVTIYPNFKKSDTFRTCFLLETGSALLKVSQEVEPSSSFNTKAPKSRTDYLKNDSSLKLLMTSHGRSKEYCVTSRDPVRLYIEPAAPGDLGAHQVKLFYDVTEGTDDQHAFPLEECRPCNEAELLRSYCASDFVVVGSMASIDTDYASESTNIGVDVSQIIRQKGSNFHRLRRDMTTLRGTIEAPKKCGISKGEGRFLFTGRIKFGQLKIRCAPYLEEWEMLARRAEMEGRLECGLD